MSYTANIRMDAVCNYLNLETRNATDMSIPCINQAKDVVIHDFKKIQSNKVPKHPEKKKQDTDEPPSKLIEGFSSDMGSMGVTYPPENKEPDYSEGTMDKICRSSFNCDLTGARPIYEKPYDICGDNQEFVGINLDGKVICKDTSPQNMTYAADAEMKESSPLDDIA